MNPSPGNTAFAETGSDQTQTAVQSGNAYLMGLLLEDKTPRRRGKGAVWLMLWRFSSNDE
jgi:hypothetical protein